MLASMTAVRFLVQRPGEVSFTVVGTFGEQRVRFWGDIPTPTRQSAAVEPALAVALLPAMASGSELSLPGSLSPQLGRALPAVQAILTSVASAFHIFDTTLESVEVTASPTQLEHADLSGNRGVGAFFTGGVDSWSTLLSNPDVTDLIFVHGLDIAIERPEVSAVVERRLAAAAAALGRRLRVVRTDVRHLLDPVVPWDIAHGPVLAAVALLFTPTCERVLVPSSTTYAEPVARGSHPLLDHLWSTEHCRIEHEGAHLTRAAKVNRVASCQEALDVLRVCWRNVDSYNCCHCEKCLRTMTALEILGALDRCPTFPLALDLDAVASVQFADPELPIWWRHNLELALDCHAAPELVKAIEACLAANEPSSTDDAVAQELQRIVSSRSWRLTSPLRRAAEAARPLSRRGRAGGRSRR